MAIATHDLIENATLEQLLGAAEDAQEPLCEFTMDCPIHGSERCENRARWVATVQCHDPDCEPRQILGCDVCHDEIIAEGNEMASAVVVSWRAL